MNILVLIFVAVLVIFFQKDSRDLRLSEKLLLIGVTSLLIYSLVRFAFMIEKFIEQGGM